ncbi:MAG: ATP synthase F1 subunit delta, partial [Desulfuromonadales bacterium]|nr:ATP synthase F1 subunit delta [Desulfuromonadales bacterium]
RRYAKALIDIAVAEKAVDGYGQELARIADVVAREDLLRLMLDSPTLPMDKKIAMLSDVIAALELSQGMTKFLGLLLDKKRIGYLAQVEESYRNQADELSGTLRARIVSAGALDDSQQTAIGASLEKQTGKKVAVTVEIDPALIGGIQAEIGGRLFDGSVKTQLKRIEESLTKG